MAETRWQSPRWLKKYLNVISTLFKIQTVQNIIKKENFSGPLSTMSSTTLCSHSLVIGGHKYVNHLFHVFLIIGIDF